MSSTGTGIAIVGMAGRFPGAPDLRSYWQNLAAGVESITRWTPEELRAKGVDPALLEDPRYVRARPLLAEIGRFDAELFGYTPREAQLVDPQQRVFLEQAQAALEDAGCDSRRFEGQIGLYAGTSLNSYLLANVLGGTSLDAAASFQALTASDKDYLATRVAYKLDLRGPALTVQTACSTSLVALHLACESLHAGECDLALAGGVSISVPQETGYLFYEGGIYSPDGHCRPFDHRASGTLFGSGVGVVVLKRLEEARADGDTVYAVVLGSAVNNDGGRKVGYTAPGVDGQAEVIAEALEVAGVPPASIGYIEAHGTGTAMGDPIEVQALDKAFRGRELPASSCALGSVKSNVGHLEAAAGIAGLIKTVLAMQHRYLPPSLHFEAPNPAIRFGPFVVNGEGRVWAPANGSPRRAGVSSFGIGGTNAHVVLEEAPVGPRVAGDEGRSQVLVLSAKSPSALAATEQNLAAHLEEETPASLVEVAQTLREGRTVFSQRLVVVADSVAAAVAALRDGSGRRAEVVKGFRPVAFLFPGQGAQHLGMGHGLYLREPIFRQAFDRCADGFEPHLSCDLRHQLFDGGEPEALQHTELAQPALFAVEVALAAWWKHLGVVPEAMLGHSVGELVAAHLAGVFSLDDAFTLVAARARAMGSQPAGAMASVPCTVEDLAPRLGPGLEIAAYNATDRLAVAGPEPAIDELCRELRSAGLRARRLATSHAFHSVAMDGAVEIFLATLRKVRLAPPEIPFLSNVTGTWITPEQATDPAYWAGHIRRPVRFAAGLEELAQKSTRVLLEVGPGQGTSQLARRVLGADARARIVSSLGSPRESEAEETEGGAAVAEAVGRLWLAGVEVDWEALRGESPRRRVPLPTYPFEGRSHWIEPGPARRSGDGLVRSTRVEDFVQLPAWKQAPLPPPVARDAAETIGPSRRWLVLAREPWPDLARALGGGVEDIEVVDAADHEATLEAFLSRLEIGSPLDIVHLRAFGEGPEKEMGEDAFFDLLALARALVRQAAGREVRLQVVASRLFRVLGTETPSPERATLLGPCQVLPRELPGASCRVIELASGSAGTDAAGTDAAGLDAVALARLVAELRDPAPPRQPVAWRGGRRWVRCFEPAPVSAPAAEPPAGPWLLTGGLGGLALALARRLAAVPGARLALLGRTQVADDDPRLEDLRRLGAEVVAVRADVTRSDELTPALVKVRERFGPLRGVVHAAGVIGDSAIARTSDQAARLVLAPKVQGTRCLVEALAEDPLDHFVLCSSVLALAGLPGQAAYAGANAFLDTFAQEKAARGVPGVLAIDWGPWSEVGMAAEPRPMEGGSALLGPLEDGVAHGRLSPMRDWVLAEHRVVGQAVLPGTAYLEMAAAAVARDGKSVELTDVVFLRPLVAGEAEVEVRLELADDSTFRITGRRVGETWQEQARGRARVVPAEAARRHDPAALRARCPGRPGDELTTPAVNGASGAGGEKPPIDWGPRWQSVREILLGDGEAIAELELAPELADDLESFQLHPALLDAASGFASRAGDGIFLPLSYGRLRLNASLPRQLTSWVRRRPEGEGGEVLRFDVTLLDGDGSELAVIEDYCLKRFHPETLSADGATPTAVAERPGADWGALARLRPDEGAEAFLRLLAHPPGEQVVVLPLGLSRVLAELERREEPAADEARAPRPEISASYAAPRDEPERTLAEIWSYGLGVEQVGVFDNFFELGGDSVIAVQVIARAQEQGLSLRPDQLFQNPTIAGLASCLEGAPEPAAAADPDDGTDFALADLDSDEMANVLAQFGGEGAG